MQISSTISHIFFPHLSPQILFILHAVGKDICFLFLTSLSAHFHESAWGVVVHHCHFCWQDLQEKL